MNVALSDYLKSSKKGLESLVKRLSIDFGYISILGTDTTGFRYQVTQTGSSVAESSWVERGFVCRVFNGSGYSEYSFSDLSDPDAVEAGIRHTATENLVEGVPLSRVPYPLIEETPVQDSFYGTVDRDPSSTSPQEIIQKLTDLKDKGMKLADYLVDFRLIYEYAHISKVFISSRRDLEQSYIWSQSYAFPIGRNDNGMKYTSRGGSGLKGTELLDEMEPKIKEAADEVGELLNAERLVPGEYEIICDPSMSGLIAHEAFGHGVEMDMFVKGRAKAVEYMHKNVASSRVSMHDGAASAEQVSSYLFDDEGTLGSDTLIIEDGVLKAGISDLLSAMKLGTKPTGNGKRESFERKAYSRMTNTFFSPGSDSLEDMIASIEKGYLLERFMSGMEDPKNWGIQCVAIKGREIINGNFSGKTVAPVYLTGFVPDLLKSITMVSSDLQLSGTGACGKGYKEFVKTSTGGPYIKTKGRLA